MILTEPTKKTNKQKKTTKTKIKTNKRQGISEMEDLPKFIHITQVTVYKVGGIFAAPNKN